MHYCKMTINKAEIYDLFYSFKDYQKEAVQIEQLIKEVAPEAHTVLDVGCGTGAHHTYLTHSFILDGLDLEPDYLPAARKKNPAGNYYEGDMVDFNLETRYQVVLCLFSAIGYTKTYGNLVSALRSFGRHLEPGGILIVEPWFSQEKIQPGRLDLKSYERGDEKVTRMNTLEVKDSVSILAFHYLYGRKGEGIVHLHEVHELGLFSEEEMHRAFEEAGFQVRFDPKGLTGRGLYLASQGEIPA